MRLKTVSVTYERKLNLGDYNSANIGAILWADVDEGEDETIAVTLLQEMARDHVKTEVMRLMKKLESKQQEAKP